MTTPLAEEIDRLATETSFSGVVRVDVGDEVELAKAYGLADRAHAIPNTVDTQFGIASGAKRFTTLAVVSLIVDGTLKLSTTARSVLGDDLPLIDDAVTVEHLLAHRSGIGDYLDEYAETYETNDYIMPVPVHQLATTEQYLAVLDGYPQQAPPGERFRYCNGGYVVLALIAERASGIDYYDLVEQRVCAPAGMGDTAFLRSDELPSGAAVGYLALDGARTNVLHLPVRGTGDGGIYTTAADIAAFWTALFAGRIVPDEWVTELTRPHSEGADGSWRYGLGFELHKTRDIVMSEGSDVGASFRSVHDPSARITHTVLSNISEGSEQVSMRLDELLDLA